MSPGSSCRADRVATPSGSGRGGAGLRRSRSARTVCPMSARAVATCRTCRRREPAAGAAGGLRSGRVRVAPVWEAGSPAPATRSRRPVPNRSTSVEPVAGRRRRTTGRRRPKASATATGRAPAGHRPPDVGTAGLVRAPASRDRVPDADAWRATGGGVTWTGSRDDNGTLNQSQRQRLQTLLADPELAAEARGGPRPAPVQGRRPRTRSAPARRPWSWQACPDGAPEVGHRDRPAAGGRHPAVTSAEVEIGSCGR